MAEPSRAPPLLCVVGATATGKTALAVDLCRRFGAEIVGADASQIYRGMDIGTGKCTEAELMGITHHLIDVVSPDEHFDANAYVELADVAIAEIRGRGRRVVVCGGTGLYLRALLDGLCQAPPLTEAVRAELRAAIAAGELEALYRELSQVDPEAASRIAPRDKQRIERALGVYRSTGRPLSSWQAEHLFAEHRYEAVVIGLRMEREAHRARIAERVRAMFDAGFVEEVEALLAAGYGSARSMAAMGYRHIAAMLGSKLTREQALLLTVRDTRRYMKRQASWFGTLRGVRWFEHPVDSEAVAAYLERPWETEAGLCRD